jgi:hypothetical protein
VVPGGWALVLLLFMVEAYISNWVSGRPMVLERVLVPYSLAFALWAALTPVVAACVHRLEQGHPGRRAPRGSHAPAQCAGPDRVHLQWLERGWEHVPLRLDLEAVQPSCPHLRRAALPGRLLLQRLLERRREHRGGRHRHRLLAQRPHLPVASRRAGGKPRPTPRGPAHPVPLQPRPPGATGRTGRARSAPSRR